MPRLRPSTLVLPACAAVLALAPLRRDWVERVYSDGVYPALQRAVTGVSNRTSIALIDVLIVVVLAWWASALILDGLGRRGASRTLWRACARTVVLASVLYVSFALLWGLNYRRLPLDERLAVDATTLTPDAIRLVAIEAAERASSLVDAAHRNPRPAGASGGSLADGFAAAQRELGLASLAEPGRPKRSMLDAYFRRAGVDGMTDPWFLETLVNDSLLPLERPFVVAHEWSHLAGLADEGDANFAGWLACLHADPASQYSGWLFLYSEAIRQVPASERADVVSHLAEGAREDLRAIAARVRRDLSPWLSMAGWRVYDRYLRANRVAAGAASYAGVVRLVAGSRLGRGVIGLGAPRPSPR